MNSSTSYIQNLSSKIFLRSINIDFDANEPERIAHFRPTSKSIPLIRGLLANDDERAFIVVAPYGSGKSLTLTYILNVIENRPRSQVVLENIEKRIEKISPRLSNDLSIRRQKRKKGLVLTLNGYQRNLPKSIEVAALKALKRNGLGRHARAIKNNNVSTIENGVKLLHTLKNIRDVDHISILWDETGRHLETLISEGRSAELSDIQFLAEFVSRSSDFPITFGITLHQSMLYHVQKMSQSVRVEWLKISGRFHTVQYFDDSKETYRLLAEIINALKVNENSSPSTFYTKIARSAKRDHGFFKDFSISETSELLKNSFPVTPAALFLLPRISARVAQNERTLFTFLFNTSISEEINVVTLYDYFSKSMQSDLGIGGTYKQWLETESAISKTGGEELPNNALKAACLLSLGTKGERTSVDKQTLLFSLQGYKQEERWKKVLMDLIDKKLLLYRKHSGEVTVWHGTDVDIRGKLADEMDRQRSTFNLIQFLNQQATPKAWKPIEYNTRYGINRYWTGKYCKSSDFEELRDLHLDVDFFAGKDGIIFYLIAESKKEFEAAKEIALNSIKNLQIITVIPNSQLQLNDAALEVWCLSLMQHNSDLIGEDPLILPEIQQMLDDARFNLHAVLNKLFQPQTEGPSWFNNGQRLLINSPSHLRKELSRITERIFHSTPIIFNELINRHEPSRTIINSRKQLILGVLERNGTSDLGLKSTTPSASMFRTVLCHTGLYTKNQDEKWDFISDPMNENIQSAGLSEIWQKMRDFFTIPTKKSPKKPRELLDELEAPPFGIRRGLIPIFFAAGIKTFANAISLSHKKEYVSDILPSVIENICRNPDDYELFVVDLDSRKRKYFIAIREIFYGDQNINNEKDVIRAAYDAIQSWLFQLPIASLSSELVSKKTKDFQYLIQDVRKYDPVDFLLNILPNECGYDYRSIDNVRNKIIPLKSELENASHTYIKKAYESVCQALSTQKSDRILGVRLLAKQWAGYFPDSIVSSSLPSIAKGLLSRMSMGYDSEELFINSLALLLVGKSTEDWNDTTALEFENKIQELVHKIENSTLQVSYEGLELNESVEIIEGLTKLVEDRLSGLINQLIHLVGDKNSEEIIKKIVKEIKNGKS